MAATIWELQPVFCGRHNPLQTAGSAHAGMRWTPLRSTTVPARSWAQTAMGDEASKTSALSKKIMLVGSRTSSRIAKYLRNAGRQVTRVSEGTTALSQAKRKHFDLVVLVSTGKTMDLTETALNLQDVSPTTQIIILAGPELREPIPITKTSVNQIIPQAQVLTLNELREFVRWL